VPGGFRWRWGGGSRTSFHAREERLAWPLRLLALLSIGWTFLILSTTASGATFSEDAVKAAFLHRFAAYVQWPHDLDETQPFVIAVDGGDDVAAQLLRLLPGLTIQDHHAELRRAQTVSDLDGVRILYVGPGRRAQTPALIQAASSRPILLVTDDDDGLAAGAIINFVRVERTVRFEVSLTAAGRSGLKINAGLLSVAARVEGRPQAGLNCPTIVADPTRGACSYLLALHDSRRWGVRVEPEFF
jgi:hypothetical protein